MRIFLFPNKNFLLTTVLLGTLVAGFSFSIPRLELLQPALAGTGSKQAPIFQDHQYLPVALNYPYWLLHEFQDYTYDSQYLEYAPSSPWQGIRFVRVETISSPSWVSWREIEILSNNKNIALGKPVTASRWYVGFAPGNAVDGEFGNWWGSGDFAPQWIEIDLQDSYSITKIRMATSQTPEGETLHRVWGRGGGD
jgi:hypothetical protein